MDYRTHIDNELTRVVVIAPITISQVRPGVIRMTTPNSVIVGQGSSIYEASDMFVTAFLAYEKGVAAAIITAQL